MKRSASAAGGVAKKCKTIAATLKESDVPQPVRSMISDTLVRAFSTYKAERHPLQNAVSDMVGKALKGTQKKLQEAIDEANKKKAAIEAEARPLTQKNDAAVAASDAASKAFADNKTALSDSKTALRDAKAAVHELEAAAKAADSETKETAAKKADLEKMSSDVITKIKEGSLHGATHGRHVRKELGSNLDDEFGECVARTFSKAFSAWGTFDHIVDKKFAEIFKNVMAGLEKDLQAAAAAKEQQAAAIERAKAAVTAADAKVKAAEEACTSTGAAAKEAETAAKASSVEAKHSHQQIQKAADVCAHAEAAMSSFKNGALAAYTEVEALAAPAPEPEKPQEAAPLVEAAMAPAPAVRTTPTVAPSPGVRMVQAVGRMASAVGNLASSPRIAPSPRAA